MHHTRKTAVWPIELGARALHTLATWAWLGRGFGRGRAPCCGEEWSEGFGGMGVAIVRDVLTAMRRTRSPGT